MASIRWRLVVGAALLALIANGLLNALPSPWLMDFGSFVASGRAASDGLNPYGIYPLTFHVVLSGFESWNPNLNPPVSIPVFELFNRLDPHEGFRLWWVSSVFAYGLTLWLLVRRYGGKVTVLWALALAGFWDTLVLGQIYVPLVLAAVGGWLLIEDDRPVLGGLLIGVVIAVKPNFLVWPGLLFLAGHLRPALAAGAAAAVLSVLPLLRYGTEIYTQWLALIASDADRAVFLTNASLSGLAQRLGSADLGKALSLVLLGLLALWAWRRRPSALRASALGLVGALLASPLAWVHYTLFLLPVFFSVRPWSWPLRLSAALLTVPVPMVLTFLNAPWWLQASVGSVYGWAVVLCLIGLLPDYSRFSTKAQTAPVASPASTSAGV
ncbi:MAG TPA: glycosyltransferase family 87 protein [Azospirillaceae bacterium]|nr:glycosyltransferase family 87 protein [Azospirillaceae bacterium]